MPKKPNAIAVKFSEDLSSFLSDAVKAWGDAQKQEPRIPDLIVSLGETLSVYVAASSVQSPSLRAGLVAAFKNNFEEMVEDKVAILLADPDEGETVH